MSNKNRKILQGQVVSDKMDKTRVVQVNGHKLHPLYKKVIATRKKIKVHDYKNDAKHGDVVKVIESRPLSKDKHWVLLKIVERAK